MKVWRASRARPRHAQTPIAVDARTDSSLQRRAQHTPLWADSVEKLIGLSPLSKL